MDFGAWNGVRVTGERAMIFYNMHAPLPPPGDGDCDDDGDEVGIFFFKHLLPELFELSSGSLELSYEVSVRSFD